MGVSMSFLRGNWGIAVKTVLKVMLSHWCRRWGCRGWRRTTKILIWWKTRKIRRNLCKISENLHKILENLSELSENMSKLWLQWRPKSYEELFLEVTFFGFFYGQVWVGRIRAKILRTPKNLPAPTPMCSVTWFAGFHYLIFQTLNLLAVLAQNSNCYIYKLDIQLLISRRLRRYD